MISLPQPLAAFGAYKQFIIYKSIPSAGRPGKTDKLPADFRTGRIVSAHDAEYWTDAATAMAAAANFGASHGVGFVFTENDPFWFIDIDNCLLPDGSGWSAIATTICNMCGGAAIEVSQSMRGLHIFGKGRPPAHGCKNEGLGLEFYHSGRFVALTGISAIGDAGLDLSHVLPRLVAEYFPPDASKSLEQAWTTEPCEEWRGSQDDDEIIRRALNSQSSAQAFGKKASFADLWTGNMEALTRCYPDPARGYDSSSADAALAQHLAFWTGRNCERIRNIMLRSALAREKWSREDYLPRTILAAVARQFDVLSDKTLEPITPTIGRGMAGVVNEAPTPKAVEGTTFATPTDQYSLFAGCVYIEDIHRILVPGGTLLKPEQFKVKFGGYTFILDPTNSKSTTDAWEAFTQSRAYRAPKVATTCFRPDLAPSAIVTNSGLTAVNTYWPVEIPRGHGSIKLFTEHLAKILPNARDAQILLCYMAACVQYKGVKFQWAPLLQGVEGNGKTLFSRCVASAIGDRYVHFPPAHEINEKFNSWLFNKIFIGVEDIYVPNQKQEIFEVLKPMITSDSLAKRAMQTDQVMANVVANFMFNSNHKDGLRKTKNDRRICTLFCAQQNASDLARDGMDGDYFPKLYDWLRREGYAIVSELLHTMPIPDEFNPATKCQRAPDTTTTAEAIRANTGSVEQEIEEAIGQGKPGFRGGWISSIMLDNLLEHIGMARRLSYIKRREILNNMGYVQHPALKDGRVNSVVLPDSGKPRLYVLPKSEIFRITDGLEAAAQYEKANSNSRIPFSLPN